MLTGTNITEVDINGKGLAGMNLNKTCKVVGCPENKPEISRMFRTKAKETFQETGQPRITGKTTIIGEFVYDAIYVSQYS